MFPFLFRRYAAAFRRPPEEQILIANNGIGAVKAIRSMRRWVSGMRQTRYCVQVVKASPVVLFVLAYKKECRTRECVVHL